MRWLWWGNVLQDEQAIYGLEKTWEKLKKQSVLNSSKIIRSNLRPDFSRFWTCLHWITSLQVSTPNWLIQMKLSNGPKPLRPSKLTFSTKMGATPTRLMSVRFATGVFWGKKLRTVTEWPLSASLKMNGSKTSKWLLPVCGNTARMSAESAGLSRLKSRRTEGVI